MLVACGERLLEAGTLLKERGSLSGENVVSHVSGVSTCLYADSRQTPGWVISDTPRALDSSD